MLIPHALVYPQLVSLGRANLSQLLVNVVGGTSCWAEMPVSDHGNVSCKPNQWLIKLQSANTYIFCKIQLKPGYYQLKVQGLGQWWISFSEICETFLTGSRKSWWRHVILARALTEMSLVLTFDWWVQLLQHTVKGKTSWPLNIHRISGIQYSVFSCGRTYSILISAIQSRAV